MVPPILKGGRSIKRNVLENCIQLFRDCSLVFFHRWAFDCRHQIFQPMSILILSTSCRSNLKLNWEQSNNREGGNYGESKLLSKVTRYVLFDEISPRDLTESCPSQYQCPDQQWDRSEELVGRMEDLCICIFVFVFCICICVGGPDASLAHCFKDPEDREARKPWFAWPWWQWQSRMDTKARMIMLNVLSHLHGTSNSMVTKLTLRTIEIGCFLT